MRHVGALFNDNISTYGVSKELKNESAYLIGPYLDAIFAFSIDQWAPDLFWPDFLSCPVLREAWLKEMTPI